MVNSEDDINDITSQLRDYPNFAQLLSQQGYDYDPEHYVKIFDGQTFKKMVKNENVNYPLSSCS